MSAIFEPLNIGKLQLKNRIMMAPMETGLADPDGFVNEHLVNYFVERAKNEVAVVITGSVGCAPEGRGLPLQLSCYDDKFVPGLTTLCEAVHQAGGKIGGQVYHAGRQATRLITGLEPVAPSAIPCPIMNDMPRELTPEEISGLVVAFGEGAARMARAGFDLIEVHLAHGYLLHSFLSPFSNKREDLYGGSLENRMRFPLQVIRRIKETVGDYPALSARISIEEFLPDGLKFEEAAIVCQELVKSGIQAISISAGSYASLPYIIQPMSFPRGLLIPYAEKIKKQVNVPVIVAGKINQAQLVEETLAGGRADMIALGRALLADPEFVTKVKGGLTDEIRSCTACNQGCIDRVIQGQGLTCLVNARAGYETERVLSKTDKPRSVFVIGGGPAGMEAARVSRLKGHRVTLVEKSNTLGGKVPAASLPPGKKDFYSIKEFLSSAMQKLEVQVKLNVDEAELEQLIKESKPDVIIVAVGAEPIIPDIAGINSEHVVTAEEILEGQKSAGKKVVVLGGGLVGLETALYLSQKGTEVRVLETLDDIARDVGPIVKVVLLQSLQENGVSWQVKVQVKSIVPGKVQGLGEEGAFDIDADTVVLAAGYRPRKIVLKSNAKITAVGDAKEAGNALDAIHEGFLAGNST